MVHWRILDSARLNGGVVGRINSVGYGGWGVKQEGLGGISPNGAHVLSLSGGVAQHMPYPASYFQLRLGQPEEFGIVFVFVFVFVFVIVFVFVFVFVPGIV